MKSLADEIKELVAEVDASVIDMQEGTDRLTASINVSQQALGESISKVNDTYQTFDDITQAADGAVTVQSEISRVIEDSRSAMQVLCQFFEETKKQYQEVVRHIDCASSLGTTKSAMFEDIDNLMAQVPPIINEIE